MTGDAKGSGSGGGPQNYSTPRVFLDAVEKRFGPIVLDLAADEQNHVCAEWLGPGSALCPDSLSEYWGSQWLRLAWGYIDSRTDPTRPTEIAPLFWLNPPFANVKPWADKCAKEAHACSSGPRIAMLVPASVGSNWFWDYVAPYAHVLQVGRMPFVFRHQRAIKDPDGYVKGYKQEEYPACFDAKGRPTPFQKDLMLCCYGMGGEGKFERWQWKEAAAA